MTALHVNYGLRDDSDEDERHCAALCERLGVRLEVERPRRPEGPGNLQAWARDTRYAAAARLALPHGAAIATGHTADDQVETILYRLASSPSRRALLGMRPRDGQLVRPLLAFTRERDHRLLRGARARLARRPDQRRGHLRAQPGAPRAGARARGDPPGRGARTCCARRSCCATRPRCSTGWSPPSSRRERSGRNTISLERLAELPPALRRLVVQRLADAAAGRPVAGAARHAEEVAALRRTGTAMLDLGGGVRAVAERGVLRAEQPMPQGPI